MSMKRKAAGRAPLETPDPKRRKVPDIEEETAEGTTAAGLKLLNTLKESRDKRGHLIANDFLVLPDRDELPDYYESTELPISVGTIENKLQRREYPNLSAVESDLKRMVANAKAYNEKTSDIHDYAEKVRKMVSNHMAKINPAYKNPDYVAVATPIPNPLTATALGRSRSKGAALDTEREEKKKPALTLHGPRSANDSSRRESSTPAVEGATDAGEDFTGNTFQQAQEKIMTEMMDLENDKGSVSGPFINLPSRELKDYYQVIKKPLSLKGVQKRVRGIQGREKPTGVSLYRSWHTFAEDMALIWDNARLYNEDGSEISNLASDLQEYFEGRLREAKAAVPEPSQPKVTLKLGGAQQEPAPQAQSQPKIKLSFGNPRATATETNGYKVDSAALQRQKDLVDAGVNGQKSIPAAGSPVSEKSHVNGVASSRPVTANGTALESRPTDSPAPHATLARNGSQDGPASGSMPPPSGFTPRVTSGSPHPQIVQPPAPPPTNPLDNRFRAPGKTDADALITNLTIAAHPILKLPKDFRLSIPPSPTLSQQSATITLPFAFQWIRIEPTFASSIFTRPYKYFACQNHQKLNPSGSNKPEESQDKAKPIYDVRLHPGMNVLEVEVITAPPRGAPKIGPGVDVEFEKTTVYVNVLTA